MSIFTRYSYRLFAIGTSERVVGHWGRQGLAPERAASAAWRSGVGGLAAAAVEEGVRLPRRGQSLLWGRHPLPGRRRHGSRPTSAARPTLPLTAGMTVATRAAAR